MAAEQLSAKELVFVTEYLRSKNGRHAAIAAGYSERSADQQASRMLKKDKVRSYLNRTEVKIERDLREMFADSAVKAYKVLEEIMTNPGAMDKDRLVAARDLLDRAGYKPVEKISADVTHSYEEQLQELMNDD
jgi:phage terminase small subunit